jgi:16S rRNA pseudouridine516 synthase
MPGPTVRLERLLANRGYCARSSVKEFLRDHEVMDEKGGRLLKPDVRVSDQLRIDGEAIDPAVLVLMMNKPVGLVCSHKETAESVEGGGLVYDLLPERWRRRDPPIATVGRLDKETSGLLLLTDDGTLLHRLTSPKHHVPRVYRATLDRDLRGNEGELFASGKLVLESDDKPLLPAELEVLGPREARLTLHEGRYHQVRRMFAAAGNHVLTLHRERFGPLELPADLAERGVRPLTPEELSRLTAK